MAAARPALAVHEEWNRRWEDRVHGNDEANKVAVDQDGNVYVAGYSTSTTTGTDYRLVKYGPDGTEIWNRRYDGAVHGQDQITGLALDADGNVYVTGSAQEVPTNPNGSVYHDIVTLKYDTNGNRLWINRYDDSFHYDDVATAIAVDADGNAYVTGYFHLGHYSVTIKIGPDGHTLWKNTYIGPNNQGLKPFALAVDAAGNSYITGTSASGEICETVKYRTDGAFLWVASFDSGNGANLGTDIAVDQNDSVYVTGLSATGLYVYGTVTLKYNSGGSELWHEVYRVNPNYPGESALAVDSKGNVVVTGGQGTVKYGPDGSRQLVLSNPGSHTPVPGIGVKVDAGDNIYVANSDDRLIVDKFGPDGRMHWQRLFSGPSGESETVTALALDRFDNVYITGFSDGSGNPAMRTVKYSQ